MSSLLFSDSSVAVAVRIRPLNKREQALKSPEIARVTSQQMVHMDDNPKTVQDDTRDYAYDAVFGPESRQTQVYDATARHLLDRVLDGYNATVFACESSSSEAEGQHVHVTCDRLLLSSFHGLAQ